MDGVVIWRITKRLHPSDKKRLHLAIKGVKIGISVSVYYISFIASRIYEIKNNATIAQLFFGEIVVIEAIIRKPAVSCKVFVNVVS